MSAPLERRCAVARSPDWNGASFALYCARNVYAAVDRRAPEAGGLAKWLEENAAGFGLSDEAIPDGSDSLSFARRRGVSEQVWGELDAALAEAEARVSNAASAPAGRWVEAIASTLELDLLESRTLGIALYYKVDNRVERLFDAMSECRGDTGRLHRDAALIALLLEAPSAEIETRLTVGAKLLASGLLQLERDAGLNVLGRLRSPIRQGVLPAADFYERRIAASSMNRSASRCVPERSRRTASTCARTFRR